MAQHVGHQGSKRECNVEVQELLSTGRPVTQLSETIVIDDDDDADVYSTPPDVSSAVDKTSENTKLMDKEHKVDVQVINQEDKNNVPDKQTEVTNKVSKRRRPRPPDLPKKKRHRTIRIALSKTCTSNISIKSFKPTISLQKLFASTSPRLIVKDNELQPAVALTEQYSTLPGQHPVHNWTIGIKRHKFRIYTK